jgi:hypothetical protein
MDTKKHFVPPLTGIHLAAITPAQYTVNVIHQQVEPINFDTDADIICPFSQALLPKPIASL